MDAQDRRENRNEKERHWSSQGELSGLGHFGPAYAPGWIEESDPEAEAGPAAPGDWQRRFQGGFGNSGSFSKTAYLGMPADARLQEEREARTDARVDDRLNEEVRTRLLELGGVQGDRINVRCERGYVTLEGQVPDGETRRRVEDIAGTTPGVREVNNRLDIG